MIVLGIETATSFGGAALWRDGSILAEAVNDGVVSHSQRLMPFIDQILRETSLALADVDGIAVSVGPGSFTGLRIGLAVGKALAHAAQKPLTAVSTLEALAERFARPGILLAPLLDARRNEVFGALFRFNASGNTAEGGGATFLQHRNTAEGGGATLLQRITPDVVQGPEALADQINEPCLMGGAGAIRYAELLSNRLGERITFAAGEENHASAAVVAAIGARQIAAGQVANALTLEPVYVRKSDAEMSLTRRNVK